MPQMSPLMWMILFASFSLLLIFSMTKIYFFAQKSLHQEEKLTVGAKNSINWMW